MPIPDRRVFIVLGTLLGAMTLASGLLLALEPGPVAARQGLALRSVDQPAETQRDLFDTEPPIVAQRYAAIVIRDSGTPGGGPNSAVNGLYHFVIGNGQGTVNGAIIQNKRWSEQLPVPFPVVRGLDAALTDKAIGICLIGDTNRQALTETQVQKLCWLVRQLQERFDIPAQRVLAPANRLFPQARLNRQLLTRRMP
jgi:hypothetical protein